MKDSRGQVGSFPPATVAADGTEYPSRGVFVEIVEPERLVWREPEFDMTTTTTLVALTDGRTEVRIEVRIHQANLPELRWLGSTRTPEAVHELNDPSVERA